MIMTRNNPLQKKADRLQTLANLIYAAADHVNRKHVEMQRAADDEVMVLTYKAAQVNRLATLCAVLAICFGVLTAACAGDPHAPGAEQPIWRIIIEFVIFGSLTALNGKLSFVLHDHAQYFKRQAHKMRIAANAQDIVC